MRSDVRFKYRVKFRAGHGSNRVDCSFELYAASEGNAAILASGMLAVQDNWSCVAIERV